MSARSHEATVPLLTVDDEEPEENIPKADKYDPMGEESHDHYIRSRNKKQTGMSKVLMVVAIGVIMAFIFVNVYYVVPMIQKWASSGKNHTGVDLNLQSGDKTVNINPSVLEKNKPCIICLYGKDNVPNSLSPQQLQQQFSDVQLSQKCNTDCEELMYTLPPKSSRPTSDYSIKSDEDTNTVNSDYDVDGSDYDDYDSDEDFSDFYTQGSGANGDYENMESDDGVEDWLGSETVAYSSSERDEQAGGGDQLTAASKEAEAAEEIAEHHTQDLDGVAVDNAKSAEESKEVTEQNPDKDASITNLNGGAVNSAESAAGTGNDYEMDDSSDEDYSQYSDYVNEWLNPDSDETDDNQDEDSEEVNDDAYSEDDTQKDSV